MATRPPNDLVNLLAERRVIPFVGAGFSATLGLPGWDDLLEEVAKEVLGHDAGEEVDYADLSAAAGGDFLRVAEYLYIRAGGNIGPLRHAMSGALRAEQPTVESSPHVELLNLGASQVYTTNFDDLIEQTFYDLDQPVEVVVLPRHVALADSRQTQIVKYHGDLRFDETLVLTESQYWTRLDFESPMDLKFRSDILGRSVLFMGYSFSDINIRIIWFKLMQMMRDVPTKDRLPSFIVRLDPNPVLEALFSEVGLQTIVLDPNGDAETAEEKVNILSDFLASLSAAASPSGRIPGTDKPMVASKRLLTSLTQRWSTASGASTTISDAELLTTLFRRQIPEKLKGYARDLLKALCDEESYLSFRFAPEIVSWAHNLWGPTGLVTGLITRSILEDFGRERILDDKSIDWSKVWSAELAEKDVSFVFRGTERELPYHEGGRILDHDLAFYIDLVSRLANGSLTSEPDVRSKAKELVERAGKIYPAAKRYKPKTNSPPEPTNLLREISASEKKLAEETNGSKEA